jgi:hypothetical protein
MPPLSAAKSAAVLAALAGVLIPLLAGGAAASEGGRAGGPGDGDEIQARGELAVGAAELTFVPVADAYVRADTPRANYGSRRFLRTDARPVARSYLRFNLRGLTGAVERALLRLHSAGWAINGYRVRVAHGRGWRERRITFRSAPRVGRVVGSSANQARTRHSSS